jgi:hypothetical protein
VRHAGRLSVLSPSGTLELTPSFHPAVPAEERRELFKDKTLRGRNGRSSSTTSQPTHGRLTRGTAPPVVVSQAPRVVRTEKVGGAQWGEW